MPAKAKPQGKGKPQAGKDAVSNGIRGQYEAHGVQGFYESYGEAYRNPHFEQIKVAMQLMLESVPLLESPSNSGETDQPSGSPGAPAAGGERATSNHSGPELLRVLDLACGSGEATLALEAANLASSEEGGLGSIVLTSACNA